LKEKTGASKAEPRKRLGEQKSVIERPEPQTRTDLSTQILQVLRKYGGRPPHFIAKALRVDEALVVADLKELQKQGKILLRTPNMEWKARGGLQKWRHLLN
jgi:predicted transcriptional regulator